MVLIATSLHVGYYATAWLLMEVIIVQARLGDSPDLRMYLLELQELAGRLLQNSPCTFLPAHTLYPKLMEELDQLGWQRLENLDPSLRWLRLRFM